MNKLGAIALILLVPTCLVSCGRLNAPQQRAAPVVDIPSLFGRSVDEVKQTLGPPTSGDGKLSLTWELHDGELTIITVWKQETKVEKFIFEPNLTSEAQKQNYKLLSYEQCGDLIGVDIHGVKPDDYAYEKGSEVANYRHLVLNGHPAYVGFEKRGGTCTGVMVAAPVENDPVQ